MKKLIFIFSLVIMTQLAFSQTAVTFTDAGQGYNKNATTIFHFSVDNSISQQTLAGYPAVLENCFAITITDNGNGHDLTLALVEDNHSNRLTVMRYFMIIGVAEISADGSNHILEDFISTYVVDM
ncbi:MAG: hypothetical protein H6582_13155 [Crocinitomicaceae bacterium]|nr:hypothetical protein [Crocinitomicaceae bacterium]